MLFSELPSGHLVRNPQEKYIFRLSTKNSLLFPELMVVGLMDTESYKNDFPVYTEAKKMRSNLGHISKIHTEYYSFFVLVSV